jgi:microsomal dipeptidase-like Zn-dependent dipeptidase
MRTFSATDRGSWTRTMTSHGHALHVAALIFGCAITPTRLAAQGPAGPWTVTVTPVAVIPIGSCSAVALKVFDPSKRDTPRSSGGDRVTIADFDMAITTPGGTAAAGQWLDAYHFSACACQAPAGQAPPVGLIATITATYPAAQLPAKRRVPGVATTTSATFTLGKPQGTFQPPECQAAGAAIAAAPTTAPPATTTTSLPIAGAPVATAPTRTAVAPTPAPTVEPTPVAATAPAVVPVNPVGFAAVQTGSGIVRLTWQPVSAASYYVVLGPGLAGGGVKVIGDTTITATAVPLGNQQWAVASYFDPGPVSTAAASFPRASLVVAEILSGWVDLHAHPMVNLAFAGKVVHGGPDIGSLLPADASCNKMVRASSMQHALDHDRPTHGGWNLLNFQCGDELRKAIMNGFQEGNKALVTGSPSWGYPDFLSWPKWDDITHQKMWYEWIERARDGGLRVMVALASNNATLASAVSGPGDLPSDDKASADLQIVETKLFVGRHPTFMEIARSAADVKRIVQANKIAVILGIEIDNIGNFNKLAPFATLPPLVVETAIRTEIQRLYDSDVRYVFPVHVLDNQFGGTAIYEHGFNTSNLREAGYYWAIECADISDGITHNYVLGTDPLENALKDAVAFVKLGLDPFRKPGAPPVCPPPEGLGKSRGHRNARGLQMYGAFAIKEMMKRGMIVDIDHMSQRTAEETLTLAESFDMPVVSGHTGRRGSAGADAENSRTKEQLARIARLHGMFGLGSDGVSASGWTSVYQQVMLDMGYLNADPAKAHYRNGAVSFGTDLNGLVKGPRPGGGTRVKYDSTFMMSRSGNKSWNYNSEGVAHYGMMADFVRDLRTMPGNGYVGPNGIALGVPGPDLVDNHLNRSADYLWRMWEKIEARKGAVR